MQMLTPPILQALVEGVRTLHFGRALRVDDHDEMEIAITDVPADRGRHASRPDVRLRLEQALGKTRKRNTDVGRPAHTARVRP